MAARVFLAAPLVIVPLLLPRLPERPIVGGLTTARLGATWCLPAAALLAAALALPAGPLAALLSLTWVALTVAVGLAALRHGLPSLLSLFRPTRVADLATDAALGFLAIGGLFLLIDRLGLAILGASAPYTLLGTIHYHFAGFGLAALVALLATPRPTRLTWLAALGLVIGVPVTGIGLILGSTLVNWLGVLLVAAGGLLTVAALARAGTAATGWRRLGLFGAAGGLTVGLLMGVLWSSATLFGVGFIDLELMVRTHGALNGAAVVVAAIALALPARLSSRRRT